MLCFTIPAQSEPNITQAVSQDCRWDYHNFCGDYGIGSPLLNCFRGNGAKLSRACVNALIQADRLGSSLGSVLRIQSEDLRQKRSQYAEEMAMKAPIKMLFPLIAFIFPAVFVMLFGPIVLAFIGMPM